METFCPIATVNSEFTAPGNQSQVVPVNMILSEGSRSYSPKMAAKPLVIPHASTEIFYAQKSMFSPLNLGCMFVTASTRRVS